MWKRRAVSKYRPMQSSGSSNIPRAMEFDDHEYYLYSQADFDSELQPSAHIIYDVHYRSNRPLFKYDKLEGKNVPTGQCEKVERVSVAFQRAILRHKVTHAFGNHIKFRNEGDPTDNDLVTLHKSYWYSVGMKNAMVGWAESCFGHGDGAICLYIDEDKDLRYKVFGYNKGDLVAQFYNPEDGFKRNVVRKYKECGNDVVEIYKSTTVQRWVKSNTDSTVFKKWYQKTTGRRSDDDYILVSEKHHGLTFCPVVYHREDDVCWGLVQGNIDDIEKLLSDLLENGKYYNYQMLFLSGAVTGLPNTGFQGKVIKSSSKDGDAKILAPADASNTFTLSLENSFKAMCDGVGAVFVRPEELKGGDYSGAYLQNLYFPEKQWCKEAYARFDSDIRELIKVFKAFVGVIENKEASMKGVRMSYEIEPYIPENKMEEANISNQSYAAGTVSRQSAAEENPISAADETRRLEEDDERKQSIEVSQAENPSAPTAQDGRFENKNI
jgi:hypothetical protein